MHGGQIAKTIFVDLVINLISTSGFKSKARVLISPFFVFPAVTFQTSVPKYLVKVTIRIVIQYIAP